MVERPSVVMAEGFPQSKAMSYLMIDGAHQITGVLPCACLPSGSGSFADAEIPVPSGDGLTFSLLHAPNPPSSLQLYIGEIQRGGGNDYTLTGNVIVFTNPIAPQQTPIAWYRF